MFAAGLIAVVSANANPLANKEVALMLRSGYSSESILREIASRRVLEALDPATKKTMLEFNASPQLISALESGQFVVSTAEAEQAKEQSADLAARRALQNEEERKRALLSQAEAKALPAAAAPRPPAATSIANALKDKLVRCQDGTVRPADPSALESKKLIAFYYSAHWCAPCRKFTPGLVDYYNRVAAEHPEFEIIFVSSDKSRFNWETYMRESRMPWPAIDYDQLAGMNGLKRLGGDGIPSLLVLDAGGHLVASSYEGDKYLGPQYALATLDKIFASTGGK
ncbi:MAG: redoxin domain-containing protein [Chthoniobacterales bacterium]|nr:redoxin domain-containing protein [Chthoniobacterales bacterium]